MPLIFVHNKLNYLPNMETFKTTTKTAVKNYLLLRLIVEDNKNVFKKYYIEKLFFYDYTSC